MWTAGASQEDSKKAERQGETGKTAKRLRQADCVRGQKDKKKKKELKQRQAVREGRVGDMAKRQVRLWGKGVTDRSAVARLSPLMGCWNSGSRGRKC